MMSLLAPGSAAATQASRGRTEKPSEAPSAETRTFAYRDDELLFPWQRRSSAVYIPVEAARGAAVPLVVFLHGVNGDGVMRKWLGGPADLRPLVDELARQVPGGFLFAAPSQTRDASSGSRLWKGFALADFVDATEKALGPVARVDRSRVLVFGHSGAGCNPEGGVVSVAQGAMRPLAVVPVDTCLDAELGKALAARPRELRLWVLWQDRSWPRHPGPFRRAVEENQPAEAWFRMDREELDDPNPHDGIVPVALRRVISSLLGPG